MSWCRTQMAVMVSQSCAVLSSVGSGCCTATPCFSLHCLQRYRCSGDTWGRLGVPHRCTEHPLPFPTSVWQMLMCFSQCPSQARPSCPERPSQEHVAAGAHPSCWFESLQGFTMLTWLQATITGCEYEKGLVQGLHRPGTSLEIICLHIPVLSLHSFPRPWHCR